MSDQELNSIESDEMVSVRLGESLTLTVIDGNDVYGYPYFTIRRWVLSDRSLNLFLDSGEVELLGTCLLQLRSSLQRQNILSLEVLSQSVAADLAGDPVVTSHRFDAHERI